MLKAFCDNELQHGRYLGRGDGHITGDSSEAVLLLVRPGEVVLRLYAENDPIPVGAKMLCGLKCIEESLRDALTAAREGKKAE